MDGNSEKTTGKRKYRNQFFFTDLRNVSKVVYDAGRQVSVRMYAGKAKNRFHDTPSLIKLFYLTYLTGARIGEMLREPKPKLLSIFPYKGYEIVKLERVNQKNFDKWEITGQSKNGKSIFKGVGDRKIITVNIPIDEEYDAKMWNYIFDNGEHRNFDFVRIFGGYENRRQVAILIESNFRTNLTDDGIKVYKQAGITPHILRHMRDFSLRVNKGYERESVMKIIGWSGTKMLDYYLLINKTLGDNAQLQMFDKHFAYLDSTRAPKFKVGDSLFSSMTS